ncbi:hypothetical protein NS183_13605 [Microbacterium testaceum]|uniref:low temperature requirement protein A n=1 Tax=Microbacterium testaceum TaxID=2033 RepID=UPI0007346EA8|nr:low temperature requirement protein A [Microbacterium testaceum]KTS84945.1 hypothetical protein NS183_13605 [Microbacterium testaceum]
MSLDKTRSLLRSRLAPSRVTNTELFFDLVYVVALTQLSTLIRSEPGALGLLQAAILLGMIWNAWIYTTWVTNWLDPDRTPTRMMLFGVMAGSIVLAVGVTGAFGPTGLWVGVAYAGMQVGRSLFTVWATRDQPSLRRNYQRILVWCTVSAALAILGGLAEGEARLVLFAAAVLVDVLGGLLQFWTPGLGRSATTDWTVDGGHFAERTQAFVLIALGESLVGVSAPLVGSTHPEPMGLLGVVGAFVAIIAMFLIYFDRWAEQGVEAIEHRSDPGKMAARAYHLVHPIIIAGIVLVAAGNEEILAPLLGHGGEHEQSAFAGALSAGGAALFVVGHGLYVFLVARILSAAHIVAAIILFALAALTTVAHLDALITGFLTGAVLVALLLVDSMRLRRHRLG